MSNYTYQQAFEELQQVVADIESGNISVDELLDKVSKASELIRICRAKLVSTEESVHQVLSTIEQPEPEEASMSETKQDATTAEERDDEFPF